eukprot:Hpha_TRINITY_DN15295_c3_g8::TRINITY_DN15295_c3_g8_i1::g.68453::m.68453
MGGGRMGGIRNRTSSPRPVSPQPEEQGSPRVYLGVLVAFLAVALFLFSTVSPGRKRGLKEILESHEAAEIEAEQDPVFQAFALAEARKEALEIAASEAQQPNTPRDPAPPATPVKSVVAPKTPPKKKAKDNAAGEDSKTPQRQSSERPKETTGEGSRSKQPVSKKSKKPSKKEDAPGKDVQEMKDLADEATDRTFRAGVGRTERPPRTEMPKKFVLAGVIETPFLEALREGLNHLFRIGALMNRGVVVPRTRFSGHCSFRTTSHAAYFDPDALFNVDEWARPWKGCAESVQTAEWEKHTGGVIDALLIINETSSSPSVLRNCQSHGELKDYYRKLNSNKPVQLFRRGVDVLDQAAESLRGYKVKEFICISKTEAQKSSAWSRITKEVSDVRTLALSHPYPFLWREKYETVCPKKKGPGLPSTKVPISKWWYTISESLSGEGGFTCAHVDAQSMVTAATAQSSTQADQVLGPCAEGMKEIVKQQVKSKGGSAKVFLISDLRPGPGGQVNIKWGPGGNKTYIRSWQKMATATIGSLGSGYCGSPEHRRFISAGSPKVLKNPGRRPLAAIMYSNPRVCALVEAAVCRTSKQKVRFGRSVFGTFATAEGAQAFETCKLVNKAIHPERLWREARSQS